MKTKTTRNTIVCYICGKSVYQLESPLVYTNQSHIGLCGGCDWRWIPTPEVQPSFTVEETPVMYPAYNVGDDEFQF